jgi:hypothetical protein
VQFLGGLLETQMSRGRFERPDGGEWRELPAHLT